MISRCCRFALFAMLLVPVAGLATSFKPIILDVSYQHDRFNTQPKDIPLSFRAYFSSFDSEDDDNGDGEADFWRIPHFVSYEMRKAEKPLGKGASRPSSWIHSKTYFNANVYPRDNSYGYSRAFRKNNPDWYVRGHLCAKYHAWRLGRNADWNTHTFFNAIPQRDKFNSRVWANLERLTDKWADKYQKIWVIVGPVFNIGEPSSYIGERSEGEREVAIPDALFKIVVRESNDGGSFETLAFIYPQSHPSYFAPSYKHTDFLVTINEIEDKTGLDFFTALDESMEDNLESALQNKLWD